MFLANTNFAYSKVITKKLLAWVAFCSEKSVMSEEGKLFQGVVSKVEPGKCWTTVFNLIAQLGL